MIQRIEYSDNLEVFKDEQVIKVIAGVRSCGKSTLFELYIDYLKKMGTENSQIIPISLEDLEIDEKIISQYIEGVYNTILS